MKFFVALICAALVAVAYAEDDQQEDPSQGVMAWLKDQAGKAKEAAEQMREKFEAKLKEEDQKIREGLELLKEKLAEAQEQAQEAKNALQTKFAHIVINRLEKDIGKLEKLEQLARKKLQELKGQDQDEE